MSVVLKIIGITLGKFKVLIKGLKVQLAMIECKHLARVLASISHVVIPVQY